MGEQCAALAQEEAGVRVEIEVLGREKYKVGGRLPLLLLRGRLFMSAAAGRACLAAHAAAPPLHHPLSQTYVLRRRPCPLQALVATSLKQKEARRYEEAEAGRYKPSAPAAALQGGAAALAAEAERARGKQERLRAAVAGVAAAEAGAWGPAAAAVVSQLERLLAHAPAAAQQCEA